MRRLLSDLPKKALIFCLLSVIGFLVYANCLPNGFILDDELLVVRNPLIHSWGQIPAIFQGSIFSAPYDLMYRPLQILSYNIDYHLWHLQPFGFHLTNIILHILNAILVYLVINALFKEAFLSLAASVLFLVHPAQVSVVAYISGRADILSACFMLLSLFCLIKFFNAKRKLFFALSLVAALLALFSRENSLLLGLFIILVIFTLSKKPKDYLLALPFILLGFSYLLLRWFIFSGSALALHSSLLSGPLRLANFLAILPRYISVLILPLDMHMFRSSALITGVSILKASLMALFVLLAAVTFVKIRKNKPLFFGLAWFIVGLLPVFLYLDGYAVLNKALMAESWLYYSSIGFFVLAVYLCGRLKTTGRLLCALFVVFYAFLTMVNNRYYKDDIALYNNILSYEPANPLRKALIVAYLKKGLYEDALLQTEKLKTIQPDSYDAFFYSGMYYLYTGQIEAAEGNFRLALSKSRNCYLYYYLSVCSGKLNRPIEAVNYALESFRLDPEYLPALIRLGDLYLQGSDMIKAKRYFNVALKLDPENKAVKDKVLRLKAKGI